jgi:hypoxanthine phosphoribosyltransferase
MKMVHVGSTVEFDVPSWNQVYTMLLNLAGKIRKSMFKPEIIVGVSRGGWPPARVLSDLLGNANLANVRAEFYVGIAETEHEPVLTQPVSVSVRGKKVLLVDEVADTGKSLKLVKEHLIGQNASEIKVATVYYKPWSIVKPDYYEKETRLWVVFPWERKEAVRKIVEKCAEDYVSVEKEKAKLVKAGMPIKLVDKFFKEILEEDC